MQPLELQVEGDESVSPMMPGDTPMNATHHALLRELR